MSPASYRAAPPRVDCVFDTTSHSRADANRVNANRPKGDETHDRPPRAGAEPLISPPTPGTRRPPPAGPRERPRGPRDHRTADRTALRADRKSTRLNSSHVSISYA